MEPDKTAGEIALQEAWEEAGLVGLLAPEPLGTYLYEKAGQTCHVLVFLLHVTDAVEQFPESHIRERVWVPLAQALIQVEDLGLRELIRGASSYSRESWGVRREA
jgi:8-oxo-dGTP pyrophosphatase MutT (NUDIX family)